jgi:[ribosomal protein S5]-alanine N-acetyltransferase
MGLDLPGVAPELAGDGVLLSAWEPADLPAIVELADDVGRRWSRSLADMRTVEDAARWLAERSGPDRVDWAVRDPASRALVGRTSLHGFTSEPRCAEIGYGVHPRHRGRGVASAAVATAVGFAFGDLALLRVELVHDVGNVASCAVATRTGFALEGVERQALGYPDGRVADLHRHGRLATDRDSPAEPAPQPLAGPELAGHGLLLRGWTPDDAAAVLAGLTDPEAVRWNPRLPLRDLDAARAWIAGRAARAAGGRAVSWAVVADGSLVGSVALRDVNLVDRWATASYWTLPAARGRGVAGRALDLASSYAVEGLGLHRVQLQHALDNTASCRVAEKAGFALEGTQRGSCLLATGFVDEHLHARLATD